MECIVCKSGETQPGTKTLTYERGDSIVVVRNVPAEVCQQCGEVYLTGTIVAELDQQLDAAFAAGAALQVRTYAAA